MDTPQARLSDASATRCFKLKLPRPTAEFEEELARRGQWIGEIVHTTKDRRAVVVESRMLVHRGPHGERIVLETNRDITERKRAGRRNRALEFDPRTPCSRADRPA